MRLKLSFQICLLLLAVLVAGCGSHYTHIYSEPQGAKVFVDGQFIGKTPCVYNDARSLGGKSYTFKVKKKGYKTITRIYSQEFQTDEAAIAGGVGLLFCLLPLFCN